MELLGVGVAEAFVIFVIALIVVGPQRFPGMAREAGRYYRMARRYAAGVTADVRGAMRDLEAEVEQQQDELRAAHDEIAAGVSSSIEDTRDGLRDIGRDARESLQDGADAPPPPEARDAAQNGAGGLLAPRELPAGDGGADGGGPAR